MGDNDGEKWIVVFLSLSLSLSLSGPNHNHVYICQSEWICGAGLHVCPQSPHHHVPASEERHQSPVKHEPGQCERAGH